MIFKTLQVVCDHVGCPCFHKGTYGDGRALVLIKQARALGWVASDGRQYCPEHVDMADVGAEWWERKRELFDAPRPCCHATGPLQPPRMRPAQGGQMTPDDVVTRARELEGAEVLLTVRGVVDHSRGWTTLLLDGIPAVRLGDQFGPRAYLVDIQPVDQ